MAALETLRFVLLGDDRASSAFNSFARNVDQTTRAVGKNNLALGDSKLKLDEIQKKAIELGRLHPDLKVNIDDAAAKLKLAVLKAELNSVGNGPDISNNSNWTNFKNKLQGIIGTTGSGAAGAGGSGLLGITTTLPAIGTVGLPALAALTAAAALLAFALAPVVAALIPVTLGFGVLAAVAGPGVVKVFKAMAASGKDLKQQMKDLTPAQRNLVREVQPLKDQFKELGKAVAPDIMKAFGSAIKIVKALMPALGPLVKAAAGAFKDLLKHLSDWITSPQGQSFINWLRTVGPKDIKNFGRVLWDIAHGIGDALHWIYSVGSWIDRFVTRWHEDWIIVKNVFRVIGDQIVIFALQTVQGILTPFTHIPIIGGQFKKARDAVHGELVKMVTDAKQASQQITDAWDSIHAKSVPLNFDLNLPTGVHITKHGNEGRKTGHAAGTAGAASGWAWVGEKGPELVRFKGGETVLPSHVSMKMGTPPGYAAGTGYNIHDAFHPPVGVFDQRMTSRAFAALDAIGRFVQNNFTVTGLSGGIPGNVSSYAGVVRQVLGMLGLPYGDAPTILSQMATESGGNPTVVNKWDSNWLAGHPSVGLMQVIAGTFGAYAGPFRNTGPFEYGVSVNPLANIYAGVNYAIHRYGNPGFLSVLGHGHGYDTGGLLPTGLSLAYNGTGRPERVLGPGQGGDTYNITVNVPATANPRETARHIADILNQGATAGVRLRKSILSANG